jgi:hypothetical protein
MKHPSSFFVVGAAAASLSLLLGSGSGVHADDYNHRYKAGDHVDLWVNKVREKTTN